MPSHLISDEEQASCQVPQTPCNTASALLRIPLSGTLNSLNMQNSFLPLGIHPSCFSLWESLFLCFLQSWFLLSLWEQPTGPLFRVFPSVLSQQVRLALLVSFDSSCLSEVFRVCGHTFTCLYIF